MIKREGKPLGLNIMSGGLLEGHIFGWLVLATLLLIAILTDGHTGRETRGFMMMSGVIPLSSQPLLEAYHKYYYYSSYFLFFLMKKFVHNNFEVLQFLPMVIREGKPWGLNKISGVIPLSVKGISSVGHRWLQIPFWPWRLENLSPMMGFLCEMEKFYFKKWALFKYNSNYSY